MGSAVGVGIIGAGYWGSKLIREYTALRNKGNIKLLRVCDSSMSALLAHQEEFSIYDQLLTQSVEELIKDSRISAVHIATPNRTHYALAKAALEGGKDVLVEKPMALHSKEAYELVDLASSLGRVLCVGHIFRFNSALRKAAQIMREGAIGKPFYARVQWTDYAHFPDRDIVFDLGPHPIDVLNQVFEDWPTHVAGFARAYRNSRQHPEVAYGILEFRGGVFAHIELSWLEPGKVRQLSVVGTDGTLIVDCGGQHVSIIRPQGTEEVLVVPNNTIEAELEHFIDSVNNKLTSTELALVGARTVEVLENLRASVWERPIPILPPQDNEMVPVSRTASIEMQEIERRRSSSQQDEEIS
jgi:predicted dehydrogenase